MKIDERTVMPITWFVAALGACFGMVSAGSFWVFSVNARLARIEQKLGIPNPVAYSVIETAQAKGEK